MGDAIGQVLVGAVALWTVLLFPALGELVSERSGVINLGTEGGMLAGAMTGIAVTITTGSSALGVLAGILAGAAAGTLHAVAVVRWRANQLASGLVVWFIALGVTSVVGSEFYGQVVPVLPTLPIPVLADLPVLGAVLFDQNVLVYAGYLLVPALWWFIGRTRAGLSLRATGERPEVVIAAGHRPARIRMTAVVTGSALAGLGGVALTLGLVGNWSDAMTNGYGFVAVAIVSFARWNPIGAALGALLFGAALAAGSVLQGHSVAINPYLLDALPYLLTVIALVLTSSRGTAWGPESLRSAIGSVA